MEKIVDVSTGKVEVAGRGAILRSLAIGSCMVIAAYDSKKKIGAMAHVMLPGRAPKKSSEKTKYAADAIDEMIELITQAGSNKDDLEVCLVGGGNVLRKKDDTVWEDNIKSTIQLLKKKDIPIRASVVGGIKRKGVSLDVETGSVFYTKGERKEKLLWKSAGGSPAEQ